MSSGNKICKHYASSNCASVSNGKQCRSYFSEMGGDVRKVPKEAVQSINQSICNPHIVEIESEAREKSLGLDKSNAEIKRFKTAIKSSFRTVKNRT